MKDASVEDAQALIHQHRLERVLVIDSEYHLRGLITVKDILKSTEHPLANKDSQGHLRAGAAVGTSVPVPRSASHCWLKLGLT
jgi:IMP dehydrogenase